MCEAIKAADMSLKNDRSLDEFRQNVVALLGFLNAETTPSDEVQM